MVEVVKATQALERDALQAMFAIQVRTERGAVTKAPGHTMGSDFLNDLSFQFDSRRKVDALSALLGLLGSRDGLRDRGQLRGGLRHSGSPCE